MCSSGLLPTFRDNLGLILKGQESWILEPRITTTRCIRSQKGAILN